MPDTGGPGKCAELEGGVFRITSRSAGAYPSLGALGWGSDILAGLYAILNSDRCSGRVHGGIHDASGMSESGLQAEGDLS